MTIYEEGAKDLASQIKYWEFVRKEQVLLYYARKSGYSRLGLQPTPTPAVSEYNAKQAIKLQLLLKSLAKSKYANEEWTLQETSAELINTQPKDCFKKRGYTVEVWFDHDKEKAFPYTNWEDIYYQDENEMWHKVQGRVDENGLYFTEINGDRTYFTIFEPDAEKYGSTGEWTIHFKNTTIVSSSSYTKRTSGEPTKRKRDDFSTTSSNTPSTSQSLSPRRLQREAVSSSSETSRLRSGGRRNQQGELSTTTKRRRSVSPEPTAVPTASQVGARHRSTQRTGLTRLQRLQAEAWDPPVLIVQGPANSLKCWRNRLPKNRLLYEFSSTVWRWIGDSHTPLGSRMLISFSSVNQRNHFLQVIKPPKHTAFSLGSFDSL